MVTSLLAAIITILFATLVTGIVFRYLRLPAILGYLLVGAVAGPHALSLIPDEDIIKSIAGFGIVFLMFTIGLEFSLPRLIALRHWVFGVGCLQVIITIAVTQIIGIHFGMSPLAAFAIGSMVAMSSTAIVIKELAEQREIYSKVGSNAVGILLAQDLSVIPLFILLASFTTETPHSVLTDFLIAIAEGILAFSLIYFSRRWLLKPLFRIVSSTRLLELFTLLVLFVVLSTSWVTHYFGLSYAFGAFLAGVMLSETEFRHQIEIEIRPFRDVLLGLFFITIGMLLDVNIWHNTWFWIVLLVMAMVFCKIMLIILLCRLAGDSLLIASRTGLILAQGGEFSFALLTFAMTRNIMPPDYAQVVLAALWISIAISPLLIRYNKAIANYFLPRGEQQDEMQTEQAILEKSRELKDHIILCGYGRVGQHIARMLEIENISYIALELDPELVQKAGLLLKPVIYGDASHPGILKAAGFSQAKAIVISFADAPSAIKILNMSKELKSSLPVLVRCKDETEIDVLKSHGATRVIAELFEEGLTLAHHLFQVIRIPEKKISMLLQHIRSGDYDVLRGILPGGFIEELYYDSHFFEQLRPIILPRNAFAINHRLDELNLDKIGVQIVAVRRGQTEHIKPHKALHLHANDIVILFGDEINLEVAERLLLEGPT